MQYLLTEEEYQKLQDTINEKKRLPTEAKLQAFCTQLADTMPVKLSWAADDKPEPWRCIITVAKKDTRDEWYCDDCPARSICPYPHKNWSK